jgi:hypothetical protein
MFYYIYMPLRGPFNLDQYNLILSIPFMTKTKVSASYISILNSHKSIDEFDNFNILMQQELLHSC